MLVANMNSCQVGKLIIKGEFGKQRFYIDLDEEKEKAHLKVYGSTVIRIKLLKYLVNKCLCFGSNQHRRVHVHHLVLAHLTGWIVLRFSFFFSFAFLLLQESYLNESIVPFIYLSSVITSPGIIFLT